MVHELDPRVVLLSFVLAYTLVFTYITWLRYHGLNAFAYDYGIMEASMWNTLHGKGVLFNTVEGASHLRVHLSPVMLLVLPLYALHPHAETLFFVQAAAIASTAIPLYYLAREKAAFGELQSLAVAGLSLTYPPLWAINLNGWHPVVLAIPFMVAAFYFYEIRRYVPFLVTSGLALSCKETVVIPFVLFGAYAYVSRWDELTSIRDLCANRGFLAINVMVLLSVAWFSLYIAIPAPPTGWSAFHAYFGYLGDSLVEMVVTAVLQPDLLSERLLRYSTFKYAIIYYTPLAFLPLLAPRTQLVSIPTMAVLVLAGIVGFYRQYPSLFVGFVLIGFVYGLARFDSAARRKLLVLCLAATVVSAGFVTTLPKRGDFHWNNAHEIEGPTPHDEVALEVIDEIPEDADVITTGYYYPYVFKRQGDTFLLENHPSTATDYPSDVEYVLLDQSTPFSYPPDIDLPDYLQENDFSLYMYADGVGLFKKGYDGPVRTPSESDRGALEVEFFRGEFQEPMFTGESLGPNKDWRGLNPLPGMPTDNFSVRWTGQLYAPESGYYYFSISADDSGELFVDGESVAGSMDKIVVADSERVYLSEGWHPFRVDHREFVGEATVAVEWSRPSSSSSRRIPHRYFSSNGTASDPSERTREHHGHRSDHGVTPGGRSSTVRWPGPASRIENEQIRWPTGSISGLDGHVV